MPLHLKLLSTSISALVFWEGAGKQGMCFFLKRWFCRHQGIGQQGRARCDKCTSLGVTNPRLLGWTWTVWAAHLLPWSQLYVSTLDTPEQQAIHKVYELPQLLRAYPPHHPHWKLLGASMWLQLHPDACASRTSLAGLGRARLNLCSPGQRVAILRLATGLITALTERQGTAMLGKTSMAGNNLLAGLHAPCKVTYLVREPNPVIPGSPHSYLFQLGIFSLNKQDKRDVICWII